MDPNDPRYNSAIHGPRTIKIVVVGASTVGKTSMINGYIKNNYEAAKIPTVLDVFTSKRKIDDHVVTISIVDTDGTDGDNNLLGTKRALAYPNTDCFMLCVAVDNRETLERVNAFKNEIVAVVPRMPILLVGTKIDVRDKNEKKCISTDELKKLYLEMGFLGIAETSFTEWED